MAAAPPGPAGGGKVDPQAAIAKHAAETQAGGTADAAIIARVEHQLQTGGLLGWLRGMSSEADSRHASESSQVHGKVEEHKQLVAQNAQTAPKDAGAAPAPGHPVHPAVANPGPPAAQGPTKAPAAAPAGGAAPAHHAISQTAPQPTVAPAVVAAGVPEPIAAQLVTAGGDAQLDAMLNSYAPKNQQAPGMLGRIKQMGDVAQNFNGQLDVYVAKGGAIENAIAKTSNFLGVGKDVSAVWANNPYRHVHGVLGGIMTGLSAVKTICSVVGSIAGKLGLILTVVGLLGMIFPPVGVAVSGIARILNAVGIICDAIAFVLSGILTGLDGVVLAQQIQAGASAEEKAATADMMMSEANEAAGGVLNMAMLFGGSFIKGLTGASKGVVSSLFKRARATIGRVSLKLTSNIEHTALKIWTKVGGKLGIAGTSMSRVGGAWKDTGLIARTSEKLAASRVGKAFYSAPKHLGSIQDKLMEKYGSTAWAKKLDRVGAWSGSAARKFDLQERLGGWAEKKGAAVGGWGAETKMGKSMADAADRAERDTREAIRHAEAHDAAHMEGERWKNYLKEQRKTEDPGRIHSQQADAKFIDAQKRKVYEESEGGFDAAEKKVATKQRVEELQTQRFERRNEEYWKNEKSGLSGQNARDREMSMVHNTRETRWAKEAEFSAQDTERRALVANAKRTEVEEARLAALNSELAPLDDARRINKMYDKELSALAGGSVHPKTPEYKNWHDVGTNVYESVEPAALMLHFVEEGSQWQSAEKYSFSKPLAFDRGGAKGASAGRGGHGTYQEIATEHRRDQLSELTQFVRTNTHASTVASTVRGMLSSVIARAPAPQPAAPQQTPASPKPAPQPKQPAAVAPTPAPTPTPTPTPAAHDATPVAVTPDVAQEGPKPPAPTAAPASGPSPDAAAAGGDPLPYWPALMPEFDHASHEFDWMRKVAVEFRKAQIDGKQKSVDTLAVYGRYEEYARLRAASAQQHQTASHQTAQQTQQNADHAGAGQTQAGQGEQKQGEAKSQAGSHAAVDLPEPESRGFWDRILGAVKRWARNKAAQIFGWIQEKIASLVLKGLCGVSMGDMREYAGALRRQQASAHGVADGAAKTSGQAQQQAIKLGAGAAKEAQGAADAIAECDRNITDADQFMADVTMFEQQLAEERAHAAAFIAQVHAAVRAEQTRQQAAAAQEAADNAHLAPPGGPADETPPVGPQPEPQPEPEPEPDAGAAEPPPPAAPDAPDAGSEGERGQIVAAADYVSTQAEDMTSRLDARREDYTNQLALAMTNRTGKDAGGTDVKGPVQKESKHVVEEFRGYAHTTKHQMDELRNVAIDPSSAAKIADTVIRVADQLDTTYAHSQEELDMLFERTYRAIQGGQHTLKDRVLNQGLTGELNRGAEHLEDRAYETAAPTMDAAATAVMPT
jgi:hypothetical protein